MGLYKTYPLQADSPRQNPLVIIDILRLIGIAFLVLAAVALAYAIDEEKVPRILLAIACANSVIAAVGAFAVASVISLLWKISTRVGQEPHAKQAPAQVAERAAPVPERRPAPNRPPAEEEAMSLARQAEFDRKLAAIDATVSDPSERARLKLRAIADYS